MISRGILLSAILSACSLIIASAMKASWTHNGAHHRCMGTSSFLRRTTANRLGNTITKDCHSKPLNSVRYRPAYATPILFAESDNNSVPFTAPTRCSSRDAASIIQNSTAHDGLLIITCDASGRGGGSKHDGIASILRIRHGTSLLPETTSQYTKGGEVDLIDVTARRTVPSRTSSEVAAISLGIKRALRTIPPPWRKHVLILSDSEFALDFFCGSEHAINVITTPTQRVGNKRKKRKGAALSTRGKKQITQSMENREDAHRRSLVSLMKETPKGILFSKLRSSSRGVKVNGRTTDDGEEVGDNMSWDGIGFIDHDAADHLSSITRSVANSYDDNEETIDSSNVVPPLGPEDIAWLENSDDDLTMPSNNENEGNSGFWQTIEVVGSEARCDRQKRNQRRTEILEEMLGSSL